MTSLCAPARLRRADPAETGHQTRLRPERGASCARMSLALWTRRTFARHTLLIGRHAPIRRRRARVQTRPCLRAPAAVTPSAPRQSRCGALDGPTKRCSKQCLDAASRSTRSRPSHSLQVRRVDPGRRALPPSRPCDRPVRTKCRLLAAAEGASRSSERNQDGSRHRVRSVVTQRELSLFAGACLRARSPAHPASQCGTDGTC
jgi:hypothetical protein